MSDPSKLTVLDKAHAVLERLNDALYGMRESHHKALKDQLMKSGLSVTSNIAEGRRKASQKEFLRFLGIALASNAELEDQLRSAKDCRAMPLQTQADLAKRADEVGRMLSGLIRRIREDLRASQ
jgi:four helix bundle protein